MDSNHRNIVNTVVEPVEGDVVVAGATDEAAKHHKHNTTDSLMDRQITIIKAK